MSSIARTRHFHTLLGPTALEGCRYRLVRELSYPDGELPASSIHTRSVAVVEERREDILHASEVLSPADTLRHMRAGRSRIHAALLTSDTLGMSMVVDLLVRVDEPGRIAYFPVIFVGHKVTDPRRPGSPTPPARVGTLTDPTASSLNPALTLRHHRYDELRVGLALRLLQDAGFAPATRGSGAAAQGRGRTGTGMIFGADDYGVVHEVDLREVDAKIAEVSQLRAAVLAGDTEPVSPTRVRECRHCPFWSHGDSQTDSCEELLYARRDVSVLLRGNEAENMRALGIYTLDDLAQQPPLTDPVLLARALVLGIPVLRRSRRIHVPRADIEVDIDAEAYLQEGAYLWGMRVSLPGHEPHYEHFVTWEELGSHAEAETFAAFFARLTELKDTADTLGLSFAAYCYGKAAENHWLTLSAKRFAPLGGPAQATVAAFINAPEWVDMQAVMRKALLSPEYGLKKLAPLAGFAWADADADGEASLGWYRAAVGRGGPVELDQRERLINYNRDDTFATAALREWLGSRAAMAALPTVHQIADAQWFDRAVTALG